MSATNRGGKRIDNDAYYTPDWCVTRFLEKAEFLRNTTGLNWLEPSAGKGAIINAVEAMQVFAPFTNSLHWTACELDPQNEHTLRSSMWINELVMGNFLETTPESYSGKLDVAIGNPPYNLAMDFVKHSFSLVSQHVIFLMRTNFLSSEKRSEWIRDHTPDVYVLPNRPSFANGGNDNSEYAWLHWDVNKPLGTPGKLVVLDSTPRAHRVRRK